MANYRLTFEVLTGSAMSNRELHTLHTEMDKYLRTILLPVGSKIQVRANASVSDSSDYPYPVHQHDGTERCNGCYDQANDGRN